MAVIDSLTLMDIAKLVGITFMALMAFVSLLFTILSVLIYRNNKTEVEAAKVEVNTATSNLKQSRNDLDSHVALSIAKMESEFRDSQVEQKASFTRDLNMQMNLSLLEFEAEISNPSNERLYVLLSRLMNTASNDCLPIIDAILERDDISDDVRKHGQLLIAEINNR